MAYKPIIDTEEAKQPKKLPWWAVLLIVLGTIIAIVVAIIVSLWQKAKKIGRGILGIFGIGKK